MHIQGIHSTTPPHAAGPGGTGPADGSAAVGRSDDSGSDVGGSGVGGAETSAVDGAAAASAGADPEGAGERPAPLRVDAQRNLEHVLRAAREVFGELGYGAPMEDVARRARVGVGTVYRRFPSKDVLVRRIAREETERLTEQARSALRQEEEPWSALSRFLRTSVASGAGRLLPPPILRADGWADGGAGGAGGGEGSEGSARVPQQRQVPEPGAGSVQPPGAGPAPMGQGGPGQDAQSGRTGLRLVEQRRAPEAERVPRPSAEAEVEDGVEDDSGAAELLGLVGQLVQRAREAGELRDDVTIRDVLLVIATSAPSLPDAAQQAAASTRLLDILLEGLRPRAAR